MGEGGDSGYHIPVDLVNRVGAIFLRLNYIFKNLTCSNSIKHHDALSLAGLEASALFP